MFGRERKESSYQLYEPSKYGGCVWLCESVCEREKACKDRNIKIVCKRKRERKEISYQLYEV